MGIAHYGLALVSLAQGEIEAALREARRAVEVNPSPWSLARLGSIYARAGRPDSARAVLGHLRAEFGSFPLQEAVIYAGLGETGRALDLLEERVGISGLKVFPLWEPLRGEPRYERLLEEMGLDDASVQETMDRLEAMDGPGEQANSLH